MVKPQNIFFASSENFKNGVLDNKDRYGCLVPLDEVLRKFFQLENVFNEVHKYYKNLVDNKGKVENIVQTISWEDITNYYNEKIVFPFFLYEDSFEIENPLGS